MWRLVGVQYRPLWPVERPLRAGLGTPSVISSSGTCSFQAPLSRETRPRSVMWFVAGQ